MNQTRGSENSITRPLFRCSQCTKSYKRSEHLQRHTAVHRAAREYGCPRCGATFQRSDVLNRHARTCNGTQSRRSSLARRACDLCIKTKRKCSPGSPPCNNCQSRGVACTFTAAARKVAPSEVEDGMAYGEDIDLSLIAIPSVTTDDSSNGSGLAEDKLWSQFLCDSLPELTAHDLDWTLLAEEMGKEEQSLRFLESFTRNTGFLDSFDCLTAEERALAYTKFKSRLAGTPMPGDELLLKAHEIVTLIKEAVEIKPRNNPVTLTWSPVLETMCIDFFGPQRIRLWLELYWAIWHPNVNYMHRPTFEFRNSKPSLLAAMCIIGALVSPSDSDRDSARLWMNCVEEMVFRDDDVCYNGERSTSFPTTGRLQAIQAMYMVCLYQNWEGDESGKSRIRRFRYSTVVAVARDIGIHNARHQSYHAVQPSTAFWHGFVVREQLIRVLMWVFLLDTAFVIFNNVPPRMAIKEMKMHLACNEACFQAPTSEICLGFLHNRPINGNHTVSSVTAAMCKRPIARGAQEMLADIGPLNMFALTSALHSVIFQTQQAFGLETELGPVRVALENWNAIWQIYSTSYAMTNKHCPLIGVEMQSDNMWQRIGFVRFASEYCLLAKLIVDRITERAHPTNSAAEADDPLDNEDGSAPTILAKYDETSMWQVNNLIAEFQRVVL